MQKLKYAIYHELYVFVVFQGQLLGKVREAIETVIQWTEQYKQ